MKNNHNIYQPQYCLKTCPPIVIRPDNSLQIGLDDTIAIRVVIPQEISQTTAATLIEKYLSPMHTLNPQTIEKSGINDEHWLKIIKQINPHLTPLGKLQQWISLAEPRRKLNVMVVGYGKISEYIVQNILQENISISHCKQLETLDKKLENCDLVILSDITVASCAILQKLHNKKIPHLFVSIYDHTGILGPLVLPGLTCCLHCMELHKQDRDQHRQAVVAQIASFRPSGDTAMVLQVASLAINEIKFIAEYRNYPHSIQPQTLSTQLRINHRPYSITEKFWSKHQKCSC